jgi:RNA polymerase sigma factor (sigma-70 family)
MSRVNADVDWENTDIDSLKSTGRELDTPLLLEECLKTLSEVDRKIFIEYSLKNRTSYEVAEEVNLSRQTITKRLKKALAKLEECLGR